MAQVNITRNTETLIGYQISTAQDMWTVYDWASSHGYSAHMNTDSNGNRTLGVTSPGGDKSQTAVMGDLAVLKNNTELTLVPAAQAAGLYTIT